MQDLDYTVWEIRKYCRQLNINFIGNRDNKTIEELKKTEAIFNTLISILHKDLIKTPRETYISGGLIEKVLLTKNHPARNSLIWNNFFFLKKRRSTVKAREGFIVQNSPLCLSPDKIDLVCEYIHIPNQEKLAYQAESNKLKNDSESN